jgi:hypothetical protein
MSATSPLRDVRKSPDVMNRKERDISVRVGLQLSLLKEVAMNEPSETKDVLVRALGEAVAKIWSNLPQAVQQLLFEEAVMSHGESIRQQLAVFLHDMHSRTSDSIKAHAMPEPDSLGG